jgi:hypothetical protein
VYQKQISGWEASLLNKKGVKKKKKKKTENHDSKFYFLDTRPGDLVADQGYF